ncbi:KGG domain-containing protein [Cognatilysobacter terrigena]|uniref:KGG domain-containing protein n=1 Tax=Cognatilysobacter terrigena TaxID=2488749 RepID=UPI001AAD19FB|nr:KGG domain-containing protein [Lysobacter terrigena]
MTLETQNRPRGGFGRMNPDRQREIASMGGRAAHRSGNAHEFDSSEARAAGRKGGEAVSRNRSHMAEIGRKGGEAVSGNRDHMAAIGRRGGVASRGALRAAAAATSTVQ